MIRRGFTLIELLVVIGIIGILSALLLPAVQRAREAGRRTQCKNNLHQLTLAVHNFEQTYKSMPTYFGYFPQTGGSRVYGSWFVHLLPYLEQGNLHSAIAADGGFGSVTTTVSPASPGYVPGHWVVPPGCVQIPDPTWIAPTGGGGTTTHQGHTYTPPTTPPSPPMIWQPAGCATWVPAVGTPAVTSTSYRGIDNYSDSTFKAARCPSDVGGRDTVVYRYSRPWGTINYEANFNAFTENKALGAPLPFVKLTDGMSNTIFFSEAMSYCDKAGKLAFWSNYQYLHSHTFGINWQNQQNTYMFQRAASPRTCNNWRLQSLHGGPINVAMADGSVRTISDSVARQETTDPMDLTPGINPAMGPNLLVWDALLLPTDGLAIADE